MKRPADQAKLLFFYLLRSSSAALANPSPSSASVVEAGHICLRLARRTDVPSIQRCNLATLPENYNAQFYTTHLRQWPDLALVAEHVMPRDSSSNTAFSSAQQPKIVGYVLGKVEDHAVGFDPITDTTITDPSKTYQDLSGNWHKLVPTGHVTSLAVLGEYRRKGLAGALMTQLHAHLGDQVDTVGLHVRQGNAAATSLYQRYGYHVEKVLDRYYADGEQAYFMKKALEQQQPDNEQHRYLRFGRPKPWHAKNGPFSLPRIVWRPEKQQDTTATVIMEEEVMTGT